jgi:hypothetical protein
LYRLHYTPHSSYLTNRTAAARAGARNFLQYVERQSLKSIEGLSVVGQFIGR